jgi:hypothetical protein
VTVVLLDRIVDRFTKPELPACSELASTAILRLDQARMILTNAQSLHSVEELKKAAQLARETIEPVFDLAMRASAKLRGEDESGGGTATSV